MRAWLLPLLLSLAACDGMGELVCRLEGDAAGQLAAPVFAASACASFPCTPAYPPGRLWNIESEYGYQACRRSLNLAQAR